MGSGDVSSSSASSRVKVICPLSTDQLIDVVLEFVSVYNSSAGIHLYSYQRLFMRRVIKSIISSEGAVITALQARQSGKSEALASLSSSLCIILPAIAKAFPDDPRLTQFIAGFWIGIFAPKMQQSAIIYERIRTRADKPEASQIYSDPDIAITVRQSRGDQVSWSNGSLVRAQTASEQSSVEGGTYHLIIVDEAQLVSEKKLNKEISPMLAATNGTLAKIGTANDLRGNFKKSIIYNVELEKSGGPRNHFEVPYDMAITEKRKAFEETGDPKHQLYEKWVAGELKRLGGNIENEEFRQNFRLLWQEAHLGAIDPESLAAAGDYQMEFVEGGFSKRYVAGLDYGRKRDVTILSIAEVETEPIIDTRAVLRPGDDTPVYFVKRFVAWYEIPGRKWHDILGQVVEALTRYSVDMIYCDGTGIGDPLSEQLAALAPSVTVVPFVMSHIGNDRAYRYYIQEIEAGRMRYVAGEETAKRPEWQEFVHEHSELLKDRVGVLIRCYAPEGEHDDYCDSGALCCLAATQPAVSNQVEVEQNPFYARGGQRNSNTSRADRYRH